jgi:hypothetical protein
MTQSSIRAIIWLADKFSKGYSAVITTVCTITILTVLFVIRAVYPQSLYLLVDSHVFEAVVLVTLLQILILLVRPREEVEIITSDIESQRKIIDLVKTGDVAKVDLISAGLSSRRSLIPELLENKVEVNILAQHPDVAVDKEDGKRLLDSLRAICQNLKLDEQKRLHVRLYYNTASPRAIILRGKTFAPTYVFIGWYFYHTKNTKISGRSNPTIFISDRQKEGRALIEFLDNMIERYSTAAESEEQTKIT